MVLTSTILLLLITRRKELRVSRQIGLRVAGAKGGLFANPDLLPR